MKLLVCGSIAFDYLMHFPGRFREHILIDSLDCLSVSFLVDRMRRSFGGVGANIAYSLALLGEKPVLVGAVGQDFGDYRAWLESKGVDTGGVLTVPDEFTASFFVSTDDVGSQIATFYIGAMNHADEIQLPALGVSADDVVIVSPDKPEAMLQHCRRAKEAGARLVFDPSQQIPRLSGEQLAEAMHGAYALALNEYEYSMLKEKTGYSDARIQAEVEVLIVTRGEKGSDVFSGGVCLGIPCVHARQVADPTGVGDAYRAGFLKGLVAGLDLETCGRLGATAACFAVEQSGPQDHHFTAQEFIDRFSVAHGTVDGLGRIIGAAVAGSR